MPARRHIILLLLALGLGGCGGAAKAHHRTVARSGEVRLERAAPPAKQHTAAADPLALITAETQDRLVVVDLRRARTLARIPVPVGPQYVAAEPGAAVLASPAAGAVTLMSGDPPRVSKVLHGFGAPHIVAISPDGEHAFVTDDARGTFNVIELHGARVVRTVRVGVGAHHFASSPDQRRVWIALGESAHRIVIVDTADISHARVIGGFDPGFAVHDLSFAPGGRTVWVTSATGPDVAVFDARDHRLIGRVPVGPPPQHVAFSRGYAYLTSGYGRTVERVAVGDLRMVRRARAPYGSFELDAAAGYVATASLLDGRLAVYTPRLELLHVLDLAPATRDVAIVVP